MFRSVRAQGIRKLRGCSSSQKKLQHIRQKIRTSIAVAEQSRIVLITPEEIHTLFAVMETPQKDVTIMKGYRVKVKYYESANDLTKVEIIKRIIKNKS